MKKLRYEDILIGSVEEKCVDLKQRKENLGTGNLINEESLKAKIFKMRNLFKTGKLPVLYFIDSPICAILPSISSTDKEIAVQYIAVEKLKSSYCSSLK